jgi:hypothetical protein
LAKVREVLSGRDSHVLTRLEHKRCLQRPRGEDRLMRRAKRARFASNGAFKYGLRSLLKIAHPPPVARFADDSSVLAERQPRPLSAVVSVRAKLPEVDHLFVGPQDALKPLGQEVLTAVCRIAAERACATCSG